jgi:hypothetical protein
MARMNIRKRSASLTARIAAIAMAKVFEKASGLKSRPSWSTRVKIGRNETAITKREKKTDGPYW